jgi:glutamate N-acetyltransferase / amino-acid N-acetyltransferase
MNFVGIELIEGGGVVSAGGFTAGAARGGIKTQGDDVALIVSEKPCVAAGVFTQNQVKAAPVWVSARHLEYSHHRAIVVNAGNANCCTGEQGRRDAEEMCRLAAEKIGAVAEEFWSARPASSATNCRWTKCKARFPPLI